MQENKNNKRVFVTGAAGAVGQAIIPGLLEQGHVVRGFDRTAATAMPELDFVQGDITDREAVRGAMTGCDTVIHLAACPGDADFRQRLLEPNVLGLYEVADAARHTQSVRRLILISSVQVINGHGFDRLVRIEDGPKPNNLYGLTKLWAEQLGQLYADLHDLSVISVRLGWLVRDGATLKKASEGEHGPRIYLSWHDAARFFQCCVTSQRPEPGAHAVVFASSKSAGVTVMDIEPARRVLGYEPRDVFPEGSPWSDEVS